VLIYLLDGMFSAAGEDISAPSLWIDVVHLSGDAEAAHHPNALTAAVGSAKQLGPPAHVDSLERSLGCVVAEGDPAIIEEARELGPALEHVVQGPSQVASPGELGTLQGASTSPGRQSRGRRLAFCGETLIGTLAVDGPVDLEQGVDLVNHLGPMGETTMGLPARVLRRNTRLLLAQDPDDLLFREP
jgi:hypothetical protein